MKVLNLFLVFLLLALGIISSSCASKASPTSATENLATVQRGDLTIDITASGNLALARTADLAFDMSGTVQEVLVEAGDSVTEGQVLAKLDTTAWEDKITTLERQLVTAQRKVTTAQRAVTTAERQLTTAEKQATATVAAKEEALTQSEISLSNAETALEKAQDTYAGPDIEVAQAAVDKAKAYLEYALQRRTESPSTTWDAVVSRAQADLKAAEKTLNTMLTGGDPDDIAIKKKQLDIAQSNLKDAEDAIEQAKEDGKIAVENATINVENVKLDVEDANTAVGDAQKALDEAKNASPLIKAPFAGFVTTVNVKGGDDVLKGKVAVQVADPNKFETNILVNEMDLPKVKLGGDGTVEVGAMGGISLPAKVTQISPTATIQSGVVNYKVKMELQSPQPTPTTQGQRPSSASGAQAPTTLTSQTAQLKEGLTVTVSIVIDSRSNVLLVPNRAITRSGKETKVQVLKDGVAESRSIKTGLSDGVNTEVTEGLSEGEQVVIPKATTTTTTQQPGGGMGFFGIGR